MSITFGLALLVSAAFGSNTAQAATTTPPYAAQGAEMMYQPASQTVKQYVQNYFADIPLMADIAGCESKFRQFGRDGKVIRGEVYQDVGVMQVNEHYHGAEADKLGLDLHTLDGNLEYARRLYEREGVTPWLSSAKCWQDSGSKDLALNNK